MSDTMLNVSEVRQRLEAKGLKIGWVITQMGLKRTAGYVMLRDGLLPKDEAVRSLALKKLSKMIGVEVSQILLRLEAKKAS